MNLIHFLGMIGAVVMPFWNIPLILKIIKRKSSGDISLVWVTGVWVCVMLILPSAIVSPDQVLRTFGIINSISFTGVFIIVLKYHNLKS
jgi:uncharacterized protein with PQ loop repeat